MSEFCESWHSLRTSVHAEVRIVLVQCLQGGHVGRPFHDLVHPFNGANHLVPLFLGEDWRTLVLCNLTLTTKRTHFYILVLVEKHTFLVWCRPISLLPWTRLEICITCRQGEKTRSWVSAGQCEGIMHMVTCKSSYCLCALQRWGNPPWPWPDAAGWSGRNAPCHSCGDVTRKKTRGAINSMHATGSPPGAFIPKPTPFSSKFKKSLCSLDVIHPTWNKTPHTLSYLNLDIKKSRLSAVPSADN